MNSAQPSRLALVALMGVSLAFVARVTAAEDGVAGATIREELPEGVTVTRLETHLQSVSLESPYASAQMVISGFTPNGDRVDVTRMVKISGADKVVEVTSRGQVKALRDGESILRFRMGELEAKLPVKVANHGTPKPAIFTRDVTPIISKLGCNAGTCHGSAKGKNGFKLSLRGYDPAFDHAALTDDLEGRRFNRAAPDRSLFLLKVSGVVPHVGGVLTGSGENYYSIFRSWVAAGAPLDLEAPRVTGIEIFPANPIIQRAGMTQQFAVVASFSDGEQRDVTALSFFESSDTEAIHVDKAGLAVALRRGEAALLVRYEGNYAAAPIVIMGDRRGFEWKDVTEYNYVDTLVYDKLQSVKTLPSEVCSDAEFIRRVNLDLTGIQPSPKQVRFFLADRRESRVKREELIDRLIGSADFVDHWSNKWADLLQVNRKFLGAEGAEALRGWINDAVASNMPYDEFVYSVLGAEGSTLKNPPAAYYKVLRDPESLLENTTQLFLGVRFSCNKCHDHPFERWTQDNYWELASFFARVGRKDAPGSTKMSRRAATQTNIPAFEEIIFDKEEGEVTPPNGKAVEAVFPYQHKAKLPEAGHRRELVARWVAAAENPYFAKSYVNRIWSYFLGIGIIEPVDDIRAGNPPTNPELLERLTNDFIGSDFDTRKLMALILKSRVYQHSIGTNEWNLDDTLNFSHAMARRLPAETLYDAIHAATGSRTRLPGMRPGTRAAELLDSSVKLSDGFLDLFGKPPRESACECERSSGMSLGQSLSLVNGPTVADAIRDPENNIASLVETIEDNGRVVEELFLSFLCRKPTEAESNALVKTLDAKDRVNLAALTETEKQTVAEALEQWEKGVNVPTWVAFEPEFYRSTGGATFTPKDDGSVLVSGERPEKDTYTVVGTTDLEGITAVRLEVIPDESQPKKSTGRSDSGEFLLSEISVTAQPLNATEKAVAVKLQNASSAGRQNASESIDGKNDDGRGWGNDQPKDRHVKAVFEFKEDVAAKSGTLLTFTLDQLRGENRTIGRFKLWLTGTARPVRAIQVPDNVAEILYVPQDKRSEKQNNVIYTYFIQSKPELARLVRRNAAQDIAWALVNSPAFLFNR